MKCSRCVLILSGAALIFLRESEALACGELKDLTLNNNTKDDATGQLTSIRGIQALTDATLSGQNTTEHLDISEYVDVSADGGNLVFSTRANFQGILDYPTQRSITGLAGQCNVTCGKDTATFSVVFLIGDANTARPRLSQPSYALTVPENYPLNVPLTTLTIAASDRDPDSNNYKISFSSSDPAFALTTPVRTSDWPATYTTQLMLTQLLDYSVKRAYNISIAATDPGGLSSGSEVSITVADVDNKQPYFVADFYSATVLDKTPVGVLDVKPSTIQARDPDTGGPLSYHLITSDTVWSKYFQIDHYQGTLQLVKAIPDTQTIPEELSFTVQALETKGQFSCQATLRIQMTPTPGTPEETSVTGYIVGMAVLGVLLVVVIVVALVDRRRRKKEQISDAEALVSEDRRDCSKFEKLAVPSNDNPAFHESEKIIATYDSVPHSTPASVSAPLHASASNAHAPQHDDCIQDLKSSLQNSLDESRTVIRTPDRSRRDSPLTRTPTPPPRRSKSPSVSSTLPPIIEAESMPTSPSASDADRSRSFFPPDEPTPDYSLKTVGFKNTVDCLEIVDRDEEEDDVVQKGDVEKQEESDRVTPNNNLEEEDSDKQTTTSTTHNEGGIKKSIEIVTGEDECEEVSTPM